MADSSDSKDFKVLIAGGGIAGLALANCFELAGIDYFLLEAHDIIAPTIGAGVALSHMALPILEQFGLWEKFCSITTPLTRIDIRDGSGDYMFPPNDTMMLADIRTGYRRAFCERGQVLKLLYENLPNREQKVLRNKRISKVLHTPNGITAYSMDGSAYAADIIVGTDGIHSKVLREMWRNANEEPGAIPKSDQKTLSATYSTLYGISTPVEGISPGVVHFLCDKKHAILYTGGLHDRVFFAVWTKLDKQYEAGSLRYSLEDCDKHAESIGDQPLLPNGALKFRDMYKNATHKALVPTEEGFHENCTWGRIVTLGDSCHKVTPSNGKGANISITSAAALTNVLKALLDRSPGRKPTYQALTKSLKSDFQDARSKKIAKIVSEANRHTRVVTRDNLIVRLAMDYLLPSYGPDGVTNNTLAMEIDPEILNFVPVPSRALTGTMPYNKILGKAAPSGSRLRWLHALPFIGFLVLAAGRMDPTNALSTIFETVQKGKIVWNSGSMQIYDSFSGNKSLDDFLKITTTFFSPWTLGYDKPAAWHAFQFLTDYGLLYAIMLIESNRRANIFTFVRLPAMFGMVSQYFGGGLILQLYFFIHSIGSPVQKIAFAKDWRMTDLQFTRTVLPAMILSYYIPSCLSLVPIDLGPLNIGSYTTGPLTLERRYWWSYAWQIFPIWVFAVQKILAWTISKPSMHIDRLYAPERDLPYIRFTIYSLAAVSAAAWWHTLSQCPYPLQNIFLPVWTPPTNWIENVANFMKWDYLMVFGAGTFYWLALLFHDLKTWEMLHAGWTRLVLTAIITIAAVGPGATAGLAWLWREQTMATEKMKGALTKDGWKGIEGGKIPMESAHASSNGKAKVGSTR